MKNHLTWTFFYSLLFSTACIRVWSRRRRYSQLVEMTKYRQKITHLHCSVGILVLCHLCGTISLAKSIDDNNTWQNIQQRDKIAVKINDLKQKSIAQPNEIRERTNKQPTKSGEKKLRTEWWCEYALKCSSHISEHKYAWNSQRSAAHITQSTHKNLRVLMFYGVLLFQCWQHQRQQNPWLQCRQY